MHHWSTSFRLKSSSVALMALTTHYFAVTSSSTAVSGTISMSHVSSSSIFSMNFVACSSDNFFVFCYNSTPISSSLRYFLELIRLHATALEALFVEIQSTLPKISDRLNDSAMNAESFSPLCLPDKREQHRGFDCRIHDWSIN